MRRLIKPTGWRKGIPYMPPLTPWESLAPPIDPLRPLNRCLGLIPELHYNSSEGPSNVATNHLTPVGLPLDPLGPCRPSP